MTATDFRALARELGAELDSDTLALRLSTAAGTLRVAYNGSDHATVASLEFDNPLRAPVEVRNMRDDDLWDLFGNPEITFDDPEFDDALLVRGKIFVARNLLNERVRRALVDLRRAVDHLRLDEYGLRVLVDGSRLSVGRTADLVELFRSFSRAAVCEHDRRGPYR